MLEIVRQKTSHYLDNTFHALKNRNFRYFWIGQCISLIGTFMQRAAQYWLVYTITDSPLLLGILGVCQFLPIFLLSLFAGPVIDRMQRRQVVIITQLSFMFQAVAITVLTFTGLIQYWHILILSSMYGITQAFDMPARQTFLFDMVGKDDIMNAVSMNSTIINLAKIIGPALAGMFMLHLGIVMCFLINAISYVAVLGSLFMIKVEKKEVQKSRTNIMREIIDGLRYIKSNQTLVIGVFIFSIVATFAMNNDVIVPVFAQDVLGQGAGGYSGLLTAAGLGSLAAALFMASRSKNGVNKYMFIYGALGTALLQLSAILTANYYISLVLLFAIGAVNIIFFNTANALFQLNVSAEYRSRVMSFYSLLAMGLTPVGNLFAGAVMDGMGGNSGFPACGLLTLLLLALVLIFMRKPISSWMKGKEQNLERK
jgi:MFS family permease